MDYTGLAMELIMKMQLLHTAKSQKNIAEALHGEAFVLRYIAFCGRDVLPGEISGEMDVSSARVAAALNSLESKGLITRRIDNNDRRRILVGITPEGKALAEKHQKTVLDCAAEMLYMLGENDAKEYVRIMGRLAELAQKCGRITTSCVN